MATKTIGVATMKAAQLSERISRWSSARFPSRALARYDPGEVRMKVQGRGICHSDVLVKEGI